MTEEIKEKLAIGVTGACVLAMAGLYVYNNLPYQSTMGAVPAPTTSYNEMQKAYSDTYLPTFKDTNNVCGIAKDGNGNLVAIASATSCPTNEILSQNYGYEYVSLSESYSPPIQNGGCGTAKYLKEANRMGKKDLAQLTKMAGGDLDNIPVEPNQKGTCPSTQELSDMVTNSIGVPVHFEYNSLNANPNGYPIVTVTPETTGMVVEILSPQDQHITEDIGKGENIRYDSRGVAIPVYLINSESNKLCENDYSGKCSLQEDKEHGFFYLKNDQNGQTYNIRSKNNVDIPTNALTRGAWELCKGDFTSCDFMPVPGGKIGTFYNNQTGEQYQNPPMDKIIE